MSSCPPFWLEDPRILITQATEFFPFTETDRRCTAAALNSFTRFGIYAGLLLAVVRMDLLWLLVGFVFAIFSAITWFWMGQHGTTREGFTQMNEEDKQEKHIKLFDQAGYSSGRNLSGRSIGHEGFDQAGYSSGRNLSVREGFDGGYEVRHIEKPTRMDIVDEAQLDAAYVPDVIGADGGRRTEPTAANPFMNLLVSEYSMNPSRPPAASIQSVAVRSDIDQFFGTMFANDPGDVFGKTQNQRMWVTQPVTTFPNDQESYQNWLYRVPGRTCKEGNGEACNFVTDNKIPWREIGPST